MTLIWWYAFLSYITSSKSWLPYSDVQWGFELGSLVQDKFSITFNVWDYDLTRIPLHKCYIKIALKHLLKFMVNSRSYDLFIILVSTGIGLKSLPPLVIRLMSMTYWGSETLFMLAGPISDKGFIHFVELLVFFCAPLRSSLNLLN